MHYFFLLAHVDLANIRAELASGQKYTPVIMAAAFSPQVKEWERCELRYVAESKLGRLETRDLLELERLLIARLEVNACTTTSTTTSSASTTTSSASTA